MICATLAAALLIAGCNRPMVRTAPFRERPDSVEPGSLIGPFSGRVVDAASGDPVGGALVYSTWSLTTGYGSEEAGAVREHVGSTTPDGFYEVPALKDVEWRGSTRLTSFSLVIYKRGYVAYRSDARYDDLKPRRDFAQLHNRVALDRWREDFSHVRHLRYVGGGTALASLTSWELDLAAAELSGTRTAETPKISVDLTPVGAADIVAAQLLTEKVVRDLTEFKGKFETGPLGDQPDTSEYSSQHFKAVGEPQTSDLAVRLWRLKGTRASTHYGNLLKLLPNLDSRDEIAERSVRATEGDIVSVVFLDTKRDAVVMIQCGIGQCKNVETVVDLARKAHLSLTRLIPAKKGKK
jgi:hypothetical protein